ncbi:MAG: aminopeptidase [Pseudomonadales bacterium]|jgi:hypothetical protein|nr:aminopeptidase [Kiritimatiellia bacterium]MDP6971965.1 aminopeptidase [Pseudomonadales bacterium]
MRKVTPFDFENFVVEVFNPESGETVLLLTDDPTPELPINVDWQARHRMVEDWRSALTDMGNSMGFEVLPVLHFAATGQSNGLFPREGIHAGEPAEVLDVLGKATLAIALTEYSMTAALVQEAMRRPGEFRAASAPLARADMEDSAFNIDHNALRVRCAEIQSCITGSVAAEVGFSTGDVCYFDLRHRQAFVDDGYLHRDKQAPPLINLPSGEVWIVPYEGDLAGVPSTTRGSIPIAGPEGGVAILQVDGNRVIEVTGESPAREHFQALLEVDPLRRNIGELAFGCNAGARVSGLFIEDEKAGLHWGLGRSEFLGGTVAAEDFASPETVMHLDTPYANGCPITIDRAELIADDGHRTTVIENGRYLV